MELHYADIEEFVGNHSINKTVCDCGAFYEMQLRDMRISISDYRISISECPIMVCENCGHLHLCPCVIYETQKTYLKMVDKCEKNSFLRMRSDVRYNYAEAACFIYDSRDMAIPGLGVDLDPTNPPGYSCPVYFDRKVLNAFYADNDYELDLFSESYGILARKGTDGWQYEWDLPFGINKNDKVIMFLGDLHRINKSDNAIHLLKAYNTESDHVIVATEFYQAQLNCMFSDPIKEKRIVSLRNAFFKKILKDHGINLFHLESEVEAKGNSLNKPINYSEEEVSRNVIILDGVLNEGIDCVELRKLCVKLSIPVPPNFEELRTRKLLQMVIASKAGEAKARDLMAALFCLNDMRVCFAHLISNDTMDRYKANVVNAFGLRDFNDYRKLYDTLIEKLYGLFMYLVITDF